MFLTQDCAAPVSIMAPCVREADFPRRVSSWELVNFAASGSLGDVYRVRPENDISAEAAYALKLMQPRWQKEPWILRLFQREAEVGRTVSHPHLVPVLGAGVDRPPYYVVMPWLDGATLAELLGTGRTLSLPQALWIVRQTAEALDALHRAGWSHGDVKPENIMVASNGHATLFDLNFARRAGESGSAADRCVMGTFEYLAPEWLTSTLRADIRSDLYSLGAVLYRVLSGRLPFSAESLAGLATQHLQSIPPDVRTLAPHVPGPIARLVHRLLAKDPLRRPQSPGELCEELMRWEILTFGERN
jgi:eukaryotic-like serine/threonine-protein kinase